jgi:S1-C subfamily serine protease
MDSVNSQTAGPLATLSAELAGCIERVAAAVVAVHAREPLPSSGVHWRPGLIVTAAHSVRREEAIRVTLPDGRVLAAELAGRDAGTDLALLKVESTDLAVAEAADGAALRVGHLVLAVARVDERGPRASLGIAGLVAGPWRTRRGGRLDQWIGLDLALYPGFSGAAVADAGGRVIGIATSAHTRTAGVAIPAATVNRVTDELLAKGFVGRAYLGLGLHPVALPEPLAQRLNLPQLDECGRQGLIALSVEPEGPADRAGVLIGDILIAFDGAPVQDTDELQALLGPDSIGRDAKLGIVRGGAWLQLAVRIGERPGLRG